MKYLKKIKKKVKNILSLIVLTRIYNEFREFTMMPKNDYIKFMRLVYKHKNNTGDVVECGVWRGGAIAGMASLLGGNRKYFLFDSFEGLPQAKEIDGIKAIKWQSNTSGSNYHNNCTADESWAIKAMEKAGQKENSIIVKGWFENTLPETDIGEIFILRLDGDWYDSTMTCLNQLFHKVKVGGLIIIDDYYAWDGCSKALHDYLSKNKRSERIFKLDTGGAYLVKK
jgi:hypothetical protein